MVLFSIILVLTFPIIISNWYYFSFISFYFCSLYLLSSFADFIGDIMIYLIYFMHAIHEAVNLEACIWRRPIREKTRHNTLCCHDNDLLRNWHLRTKYVDDANSLKSSQETLYVCLT